MSSFNRRSVLLGLLALPGCGFTPVYGPATTLRGTVQVGTPDSTNAFTLVRALETRLGVAEEPIYTLALSVDLNEEGSVITRTQDIDRFSIRGEAAYTLATLDGTAVAQESVRAFTSYSAAGTPLSTRAARADAQDRLMEILADQIVTRLAAAVA